MSHSQGTVISADFLGFVRREGDPDLPVLVSALQQQAEQDRPTAHRFDGPPLYLFTMGSPLRQLYSVAFPHLFAWVRGAQGNWRKPLPAVPRFDAIRDGAHPTEHVRDRYVIDDGESPDPLKIGLERWVNAYRSGDYVGRELWRSDGCGWRFQHYAPEGRWEAPTPASRSAYWADPSILVSEDAGGTRRELCIGQGAHTHYWDHTARAVAIELDQLITDAARQAPEVSRRWARRLNMTT